MGVVDIKEGFTGSGGGRSKDGRSAVRVFTVQLGAATTDESVYLEASAGGIAIPRHGQGHPNDSWLRVDSVEGRARGLLLFDVSVRYARRQRGTDPEAQTPFDEPPEVEWSWDVSTEAIDIDAQDGEPILNTAGEPFDPPITREVADLVLTITRAEPTYDPNKAMKFKNVLNKTAFLGIEAGKARCFPISARKVYEGPNDIFWRVTYRFGFRSDTWNQRVLCQGFRQKTGTNAAGEATYEQILDDVGNPLSEPVNLGITGQVLAANQSPLWLSFAKYPREDFSELGLGI